MGGGLGSRSSISRAGMPGSFGGSIADLANAGVPSASEDESQQRRFFTCTVGQKPSAAKFFLHDVDEVSELITSLASVHRRKTKRESQSSSSFIPFFHNSYSLADV